MDAHGINALFKTLYSEYGKQHWWPAETQFEVCVGAILTQNTSWKNVEKAIAQMKKKKLLSEKAILDSDTAVLEEAIRPSGFFKQKAKCLKDFCTQAYFYGIKQMSVQDAREHLLSIKGIGCETADSILLYAFNKPIFVVDAYTKRIYGRIYEGKDSTSLDYDDVRFIFESSLGKSAAKYNEMHALLVEHAKLFCAKNNPRCVSCPALEMCKFGRKQSKSKN